MTLATRLSGPLQVERLDNGRRQLLRDLQIDAGVDLKLGVDVYPGFSISEDSTTIATVPKGFTTDFSSIPGFARALYRFDSVDLAGTCHDYAYYVGVPQPAADELWRLVATSGQKRVSSIRGRIGWLALRVFGGFAYRDHKEKRRLRQAK